VVHKRTIPAFAISTLMDTVDSKMRSMFHVPWVTVVAGRQTRRKAGTLSKEDALTIKISKLDPIAFCP